MIPDYKHYPIDILKRDNLNSWKPPIYSPDLVAWFHQYFQVSETYFKHHYQSTVMKPKSSQQQQYPKHLYKPSDQLLCSNNIYDPKRPCKNHPLWWHPRHAYPWCPVHVSSQTIIVISQLWMNDLYEIHQGYLLQQYPFLKGRLNHFNSILYDNGIEPKQ